MKVNAKSLGLKASTDSDCLMSIDKLFQSKRAMIRKGYLIKLVSMSIRANDIILVVSELKSKKILDIQPL